MNTASGQHWGRGIDMTQITKPELPIGYWLKRADNLLTEQINKGQAANGVSRFEWQVLNRLHETGSASETQLFEIMRTFVDAPNLDEIISRLTERGWVEQSEDSKHDALAYQLTADGQRQHGVIVGTQKDVRQRAMQGISAEEYAATIRILQRIVHNLEAS
jgi:DNA-binding MarR family transcriptional regulator